jgi:hypothetical protein
LRDDRQPGGAPIAPAWHGKERRTRLASEPVLIA